MNHRIRRAAASAAVLALMVTGCASEDASADGAATSSTPETTSAAEPSTDPTTEVAEDPITEEGATVEQWASIIAEQQLSIDETWDKYDDADCGVLLMGPDVMCGVLGLTLYYNIQTLAVKIEGAQKPGVPAYIGEPPAEIADLVAKTHDAASAAVTAWETLDAADCESGQCVSQAFQYDSAVNDVRGQLAAWAPYL